MVLLLCGFASYLFVQFLKYAFPIREQLTQLFLYLLSAGGVSVYYFQNQPVHLVVYAFAGGGLAVLIDQLVYVTSMGGDYLKVANVRSRRRGG